MSCTRRELLTRSLGGALALGLSGPRLAAADPPRVQRPAATALIQIWLWGGPSHLETFDPKPHAGRDYSGPYTKEEPTAIDGICVSPLLPQLAQQVHRYALLRGMTHGNNSHETAAYLMQAGRPAGEELVHPSLGALVAYQARRAGWDRALPPFITLTEDPGRFAQEGFLGEAARPFITGGDPTKEPFAVEGLVAAGILDDRQRARRELLTRIDRLLREQADAGIIRELASHRERAWDMILGETRQVFDLQRERAELRDRYGRNQLGQSCLMARRLIENGVRAVTINCPGWDTHKKSFQILPRKIAELDAGVAALLQDLDERGLLQRTLVWVGGEFGRTPAISWEPPWDGGRGHHGKAFSVLIAGGGLRGGRVIGATDERGETVTERPIWPWDLLGTLMDRLGIPLDLALPTPQGATVPASPLADGSVADCTGGLLRELC